MGSNLARIFHVIAKSISKVIKLFISSVNITYQFIFRVNIETIYVGLRYLKTGTFLLKLLASTLIRKFLFELM